MTTKDPMSELLLPQAMVDPKTLIPDPGNPRIHQTERLKQGVKNFSDKGARVTRTGQYRAVVVNKRTGQLVAGHGTVEALIANGADLVQVSYIDVDEQTAQEILLWDNWSSDAASNDDRLLAEMLRKLTENGGLERTGFNDDDLHALEALLGNNPWGPDSDEDVNDILDKADESAWPTITCKLAPALHERFMAAHGTDDAARIMTLIGLAGL